MWIYTARVSFAVVFFCLCFSPRPSQAQDSLLRIIQFDVGQGDAALIVTPEGKRLLIDAGPSPTDVAAELAGLGVDTIHLVVASHNHADHIRGMAAVLSHFPVQAYMDNGLPHTTATYRQTLGALEASGAQYLNPTHRTIMLGSLNIRVLPPPEGFGGQKNTSVGLLLEYGTFRALYTGDSERAQLAAWLRLGSIPSVTLVKAAHHGATNGTTSGWIRATTPTLVIISVSSSNGYGHPSPAVEEAWQSVGATVYRTDRDGSIEIHVSPSGLVTVFMNADRREAPAPSNKFPA